MKKIFALMLTLCMAITALTGCSDPVADEFENFMNVEMVEANANYVNITTEVGRWEEFETNEALLGSLNEVLIPKCDETLDILSKIQLETEEVKALKDKFQKVIELYKEGFGLLVEAITTGDEEKINASNAKLDEGVALIDEYNKGLEALASEKGLTIEY